MKSLILLAMTMTSAWAYEPAGNVRNNTLIKSYGVTSPTPSYDDPIVPTTRVVVPTLYTTGFASRIITPQQTEIYTEEKRVEEKRDVVVPAVKKEEKKTVVAKPVVQKTVVKADDLEDRPAVKKPTPKKTATGFVSLKHVDNVPVPEIYRKQVAYNEVVTASPVQNTQAQEVTTSNSNTVVNDTPKMNDLPNCRYKTKGPDCWKKFSLQEKINKVIANVNYLNDLHDTKIDPRYMLCTGYRESTFEPGATNSERARGIFQVIPSTAKAAARLGSKLPGYIGKTGSQYTDAMVHSSLAQTEISFLVLKLKVKEGFVNSRITKGGATKDDYRSLAWAYVGKTNSKYSTSYRNHISSCYNCLRDGVTDTHLRDGLETSKIQSCLKKAK